MSWGVKGRRYLLRLPGRVPRGEDKSGLPHLWPCALEGTLGQERAVNFWDPGGNGPRLASDCKEGIEVGKRSNKAIQAWQIAFGVVSPLPTEVPEPTTAALGQEHKSFPGCCVSLFGRNPPLLPSRGKHLPLSLRETYPGWVFARTSGTPLSGTSAVSRAAPRGSAPTGRVVCLNFHHHPGEQLPSSLRGLPPGRGRLRRSADNSPIIQPHCMHIDFAGKVPTCHSTTCSEIPHLSFDPVAQSVATEATGTFGRNVFPELF